MPIDAIVDDGVDDRGPSGKHVRRSLESAFSGRGFGQLSLGNSSSLPKNQCRAGEIKPSINKEKRLLTSSGDGRDNEAPDLDGSRHGGDDGAGALLIRGRRPLS